MAESSQADVIHILILEDDPDDIELMERQLQAAGMNFIARYADSQKAFEQGLTDSDLDLVLSDYYLPGFTGLQALVICKSIAPYIPFILVSGAISENWAFKLVQEGATDYVLKDRLDKLPYAVKRAVHEKGLLTRRRQAEESALQALQAGLPEGNMGEEPQTKLTRILIVEDEPDDVALITRVIEQASLQCLIEWTDNEEDLRQKLVDFQPDILLVDFWLTQFDGFTALTLARSIRKDIPVILVTGVLKEETALEARKIGMTDYVMKDRLFRLPAVMARALQELEEARRLAKIEESAKEIALRMQAVCETLADALITIDELGNILTANKAVEKIFGYEPEELLAKNVSVLMPSPYKEEHDSYIRRYLDTGERRIIGIGREVLALRKNGTTFPADLSVSEFKLAGGQFFTGIVKDASVRKRSEALEKKNALLEQREDFLATLSHDLKNPLIGLRGILNSFLSGQIGPLSEEQVQYLLLCKNSNDSMLLMLQNLISVLRYEHDIETILFEKTDLLPIVRAAISEFSALAAQKQIEMRASLPNPVSSIETDSSSIRRILQNLLTNAINYTPSGGTIELSVKEDAETVEINVRDNGPGIAEQDQKQLFERFWTGSGGRGHAASTGLGLYLCKKIVDAHHGKISCTSKKGNGATFTVSLPLWQPESRCLSRP